jgi:hypothetical protein
MFIAQGVCVSLIGKHGDLFVSQIAGEVEREVEGRIVPDGEVEVMKREGRVTGVPGEGS